MTDGAVSEDDVLITAELFRRSPRFPNLEAENRVLRDLGRQLTKPPQVILKHFTEIAKELCQAGTAGVSLIETTSSGEECFRWVAIAGVYQAFVGEATPRDFSPCGVCLKRGGVQLYAYPERYFTYLQQIQPPAVEGLVMPLMLEEQALGVIWIVSHCGQRQFDEEDVRIMTSLADFLAAALSSAQARQTAEELSHREKAARAVCEAAQQMAETTKAHLDSALASIKDQFLILDREWCYTYVNERVVEVTGTPKENLLGKSIWDVFPDTIDNEFYNQVHRAVAAQTNVQFEYFYSAWQRWFENRIYPYANSVTILVTDITDRKQAEASLRQREAELSLVTNAVPVLISFIDSEQRYRFNNQKYEEWFGHPATEIYGKPLWKVLGKAAYETIRPYVEQVLAGEQVTFESQVPYQDGGTRYVYATYVPQFDSQGRVEGFVALVNDVSERKQAEAKIQQQADRLQRLAEASLAINATLSLNEIVQLITEQARDIIGAHQSVTSMTINENWAQGIQAVSLSDKYAQWRDYDEKPDGSGIYALICQMQHPMRMTQAQLEAHSAWRGFGKEAENHPPMRGWLAVPLTSRNGKNIGLIQLSDKYEGEFTEEDESILVQLAQMAAAAIDNAQLYEESQQANRIKDEFLAVLSHELRSPLNPILGWTQLLQTRKFDEQSRQQALKTIERNAKLQTQLIEDLLDISRILRGKMSLNSCPVNLVTTIQSAIETVRLAAEAKGIEIQTMLASDLEPVSGDSARLQQIVWNLLANAIKFTKSEEAPSSHGEAARSWGSPHERLLNPKGGVSLTPNGRAVEVRLERVGTDAQIVVKDTGKGIRPEFLPYVFEYFRQEDSTTTRKFGGLGLGLALVRYLTELHGGTVKAESQGEGLGAIFTVRLPLLRNEGGKMKDEDQNSLLLTPHPTPLTGLRILIVDDEADMRELMLTILEQAGAEVTMAASAAEALAAFNSFKPDVLISDIGMPDVDGYMLMRQIRERSPEEGGNILAVSEAMPKAIALTAYAGEVNQQQALAAGFQRHLAKPIDPAESVQVITILIGYRND